MKKLLFFLTSLIILVNWAYPQGNFLKKGQNGLLGSAVFMSNSDATSLGGAFGFSFSGIFDVSLSYAGVKYDESEYGNMTAKALMPSVAFHPIKQNSSDAPVSISIFASYEHDNFSSDLLDFYSIEQKASAISGGGAVYRDIQISNHSYLQPFGAVTYVSTKITTSYIGHSTKNTDTRTVFRIGSSIVFVLTNNADLIITPSVLFDKDYTTFAISLSALSRLSSK